MVLINDAFLSLNLNESQESDDEFAELFGQEKKLEKMKLGKYNLVDLLQQFCVTWPSTYTNTLNKPPYISIMVQRLSDNPFNEAVNKAILLLMVRDYSTKFKNENNELDTPRRK